MPYLDRKQRRSSELENTMNDLSTPPSLHRHRREHGCIDRVSGLDVVTDMLQEQAELGKSVTAFWTNIDRFRQINLSFGHAGGDQLIANLVSRVRSVTPVGCEMLRMGGDEFVILAPGLDADDAEYLARRLRNEIGFQIAIEDVWIRPSASIGVAFSYPEESASELLERAEEAMHEAKACGGNRYVLAFKGDASKRRMTMALSRKALAIEGALHAAMEAGVMTLHFQPIVRQDGSIEALEALMRCTAPGMHISPDEFIPVAENTGLITRLGEWSLFKGCQFAAVLKAEGIDTKVAINVSRAQLLSEDFLPALNAARLCADVDACAIELELTESLIMDLSPRIQNHLKSIRDAGFSLAIDDFGTGFSSLAALKDLPVSKVKFDRSFIKSLPTDERAVVIVRSLCNMAKELGITVVAEGIETPEQQDCCVRAGIDAIQGFFHARPMPEADALAWLKNRSV
jgi:diguanylate cyclase (GGDEF)-like protein